MVSLRLLGLRADWRLLRWAALLTLVFVAWTATVWMGTKDEGRSSAGRSQHFGEWPSRFGSLEGSDEASYAIYVSSDRMAGTSLTPSPSEPGILGYAAIGSKGSMPHSDFSNFVNGSRVVTGAEPYRASTMSVYVQSPVDSPPHNQFQLAIYEDHRGAPRRLVARSEPGILVPNSWNTLPIVADLQAEAAYWLMYNSNASRNPVNRLAFAPSQLDSLDSVIRYHRLEGLERIAHGLEVVGDFSLMTAAVVVLCVWAGRKRPLTGVVFFSAFLAGQVLVLVSKEVLFAPYGDYPSGHVMRLVFAVLLLAFILPHRVVYVGGAVLVALESVSVIYMGGHYAEEVVGGLFLGVIAAIAAQGFIPVDSAPTFKAARLG